jgi:hypothetical protein
MSIQLAANAPARREASRAPMRPLAVTPPRVLQSARTPAQLSFFFKRG